MTEVEVDNFRKLIKDMYDGFPNGQVRTIVERVVITEAMRNHLVDTKFLLKESHVVDGREEVWYMLGPNSLALLSSWETEELTKSIKKLTWVVVVMTALSLILLIIQTLRIVEII